MIRPSGFRGAAFGTAEDGDGRSDERSRNAISARLDIPVAWAYPQQVHGAEVIIVDSPGPAGEADALVTTTEGLPLCVATADCVPVVIEGAISAAIAHAGWRGVVAGVVPATLEAMRSIGDRPLRAAIGPAIGACCYEVGPDVAGRFGSHMARTTTGGRSVDLKSAIEAQLGDVPVWTSDLCTFMSSDLYSFRRDRSRERQVTLTWLPIG